MQVALQPILDFYQNWQPMTVNQTCDADVGDFDVGEESTVLVSIQKIRQQWDPFETPPWDGVDHLTESDIIKAIACKTMMSSPFSQNKMEPKKEWTKQDHINRIAWLVVNGWDDHIVLDVGVPELNLCVQWPLVDGNHRFAAAIVRKDTVIECEIPGSEHHIQSLFFEKEKPTRERQRN